MITIRFGQAPPDVQAAILYRHAGRRTPSERLGEWLIKKRQEVMTTMAKKKKKKKKQKPKDVE